MSAVENYVGATRPGDAEAARLYAAHSAEILAFCRRQLASLGEAEDALQTTFLYALRALRRGVVPECERAWLTTIAKNVCHTQRRTLGRRGTLTSEVDLDRIALAQPVSDEAELVGTLRDALAALPENQRSALVMREWQGLGHDEIAAKLELTSTATSALLTRARRSLATALTAAGRPRAALDLSLLLGALRGHLRALFGGAASKTAVGAAVASVAVGGVVAGRALERPSPPPAPTAPSVAEPRATHVAPIATAVTRAPARRLVPPARVRTPGGTAASAKAPSTAARPQAPPPGGTSRTAVPPRSLDPATPTQSSPESAKPAKSEGGAPTRPAPLQIPDTGLPVQVPGVDLPPLSAPPVPPLPSLPPVPAPDATSGLPVEAPPLPPLPTLP
jgi:RNA polymerase sigma factor (sigma-70 family)